ncbi:hypothetical protein [Nitrosophilus kaiyonis]|uniref:hypothetical protein n=1 Tax=Nitrosophilus kaiyonis TaxID=2930200 RepID=UPI0024935AAE|nr:hypothetical protein [Nitrosophilus kaiyonis]
MNRHLKYLYFLIIFILFSFIGEGIFLYSKKIDIKTKKESVKVITMPDLAISTEAHFIRHRSITDLFEVFGLGPSLLPYFPSEFIYHPPKYLNAKEEIKLEP